MNNIRFSILIPVYNRDVYVKECIDSIFSQTFNDYEIIAIDDGSTDRTLDVLKSYGERIIALSQANRGPEVARSLGSLQANGEYLVFLDSDDFLLPWALETYNLIIQECNSPALIIGTLHYYRDGQYVQENAGPNNIIEVLKYRDYLSKDTSVDLSCSNIIVKNSVFRQAGWHRQNAPRAFPADEHDTVLRFGTSGACVVLKTPVTVAYRVHSSNAILNVGRMINLGIMSLVNAERKGQYPGGGKRRLARYSIIGGMAMCWVSHAIQAHRFILALKLLVCTGPMLVAGALNKLCRLFRRRTPSIILHEQKLNYPCGITVTETLLNNCYDGKKLEMLK